MSTPCLPENRYHWKFLRPRLHRLVQCMDASGRLDREGKALFRDMLLDRDLPDPLVLSLHPEAWFGTFDELSEPVRRAILRAIRERLRAEASARETGEWYQKLLRFLWRVKGAPWEWSEQPGRWQRHVRELMAVTALAARRAPCQIRITGKRSLDRLRRIAGGRPCLGDVLHRLGVDPRDLSVCYARGISQEEGYRGYWHDAERNITVGCLLGIDLQPSHDGMHLIECNADTGIIYQRSKLLGPEDPLAENLCGFAAQKGYRFLWLVVNDSDGINPLLSAQLEEAARRHGLVLRIVNLPNVPSAEYPRMWKLPAELENDTLLLRIRHYPSTIDWLFGHKPATYRALALYKAASGDPDLRLPAFGPDPVLADIAPEEPFPNLVYKPSDLARQRGILLFKARDAEQVREFLRTGHPRPSGASLEDRVVLALHRGSGVFQAYIRPRLWPGRRIAKVRAMIVVSPVGSALVEAEYHVSRLAVPERLPIGPVRDPRPFLVGGGGTNQPRLVSEREFREIEPAALAVARGLAWAIEYGHLTAPGEDAH